MKNLKLFLFLPSLLGITMLAYGQKYTGLTATSSSGNASVAVDGDMGTRWESDWSDPQWLVVDLGEIKNVGAIKIYWEAANAKDYTISFSTDGVNYSGDLTYTGMAEGSRTDNITEINVDCQYIKMNGTARNLVYGYSIWEFEVYPQVAPVLTSIVVLPEKPSIVLGNTQQFTAEGRDQLNNPYTLSGTTTWNVDGSGTSITSDGLFSSTQKGLFTVTATNSSISGSTTIEVLPTNPNLSPSATATASSGDGTLAIDNNGGSRWESEQGVDPQWILVDLGAKMSITDIIIDWETANAKNYIIEYSNDNLNWNTYQSPTDMPEGPRTDRFYNANFQARYVRITGTERNTVYGYSIWELKIYGTDTVATVLSNANNDKISIYPNPATDKLFVSGSLNVDISIYTLEGKFVKQKENTKQINVSDISSGVYIVKVKNKLNGIDKSIKVKVK
ncbi:exported hypothetical protein [uncultured Paludibacter sp.]|uniref:F5/8 type C domain-containing protein n=1 Tax=uncultured Paludibacter sp. TaxID=497635 RepID=A0A653AJZ0_9BACT|nr:exported hypothetical protein [uncultured Paludibacter sp.]